MSFSIRNTVVKSLKKEVDGNAKKLKTTDAYGSVLSVSKNNNKSTLEIKGNFKVGNIYKPVSSTFGEGGETTSGMKVFTYTNSTKVYTDITNEVMSSGSSVAVFPELSPGNALYIGSVIDPRKFSGIILNITTVINNYQDMWFSYWDGTTWANTNIMVTQAHRPYAQDIFQHTEETQVRFGKITNWTQTTVNSVKGYWFRILLLYSIAGSPLVDQIKLQTNNISISPDGFVEFFGIARPTKTIEVLGEWKYIGNNTTDTTIYASENLFFAGKNNTFPNGSDVSIATAFLLPEDLCTSYPLRLEWRYITNLSSNNNHIIWTVYYGHTRTNNLLHSTPVTGKLPNEKSVDVIHQFPDVNIYNEQSAEINIPKAKTIYPNFSSDTLWIKLRRDGVNDPYLGDVYGVAIRITYKAWCLGKYE